MKKFIAYIPAGYPDLLTTQKILESLNGLGIKGVEIGVPFSDPIADGPVIQRAHKVALDNGTNLKKILAMLEKIEVDYELYVMSYLNPIVNYPEGREVLIERLLEVKIKGLVIPDLPLREVKNVKLKFPVIPFVAPNTRDEELANIDEIDAPFVYYISRYGVTGEKDSIPFLNHLKKVKLFVSSPVFVGFGISKKEQVENILKIADGVIVGSTLVKLIEQGYEKITEKVKELTDFDSD
ncbi:MAG: tryptophan synthase alpha chain [Thermotogaceae bacterium]|jgi:tryptophan synthase alpha chain|nr:tryptophan synthase alpha chain [Thermotogaceae bacterium]MDN5338456.1 tryptophan synthase alpha chain [Thermotogaceae bacterium]